MEDNKTPFKYKIVGAIMSLSLCLLIAMAVFAAAAAAEIARISLIGIDLDLSNIGSFTMFLIKMGFMFPSSIFIVSVMVIWSDL